jgi:hypothetical protein
MTGIYLDQDQADDLCELLGHVRTVAWWLLFASDEITGDLAQAAYPPTSTPAVPSSGSPKTSSTSATGRTRPSIQATTTATSPTRRTAATPPHRPEQAQRPLSATGLTTQLP